MRRVRERAASIAARARAWGATQSSICSSSSPPPAAAAAALARCSRGARAAHRKRERAPFGALGVGLVDAELRGLDADVVAIVALNDAHRHLLPDARQPAQRHDRLVRVLVESLVARLSRGCEEGVEDGGLALEDGARRVRRPAIQSASGAVVRARLRDRQAHRCRIGVAFRLADGWPRGLERGRPGDAHPQV